MSNADERNVTDFELIPRKRHLPQESPGDFPEFVLDDSGQFALYVADLVIVGMRQYVSSNPDCELGGFLLGRHYERDGRYVVEVSGYQPLPSQNSGAAHFEFDEHALRAFWARRPKSGSEYMVGWFHSHPRLGDPFMSTLDLNVHQHYCKKPWYVSCVLGAGEWALPIGFWRMAEDRLLAINEYHVRMTPAVPMGEQSRRFLRASVGDERALDVLLRGLRQLLLDVGYVGNERFLQVLDGFGEVEKSARTGASGPAAVAGFLSLIARVADDKRLADWLAPLCERLQRVRFQDDTGHLCIYADSVRSQITVDDGYCASWDPGRGGLIMACFTSNSFWGVDVSEIGHIVSAEFGPDDCLWVLGDANLLVRVTMTTIGLPSLREGPGVQEPTRVMRFVFDSLKSPVRQISFCDQALWVITDSELHEFRSITGSIIDVEDIVSVNRYPTHGSGTTVLVRDRLNRPASVLVLDEGVLTYTALATDRSVSAKVPEDWKSWRLRQAVRSTLGLYVLLDDDAAGQLLVLDIETLELKIQFVQHRVDGQRNPLTALSVDDLQRVFVKRGNIVFLVGESGPPETSWYHQRTTLQS
jgi:proteasome lid subunit RPN8/RPN11